jgi:hypothetical protein
MVIDLIAGLVVVMPSDHVCIIPEIMGHIEYKVSYNLLD